MTDLGQLESPQLGPVRVIRYRSDILVVMTATPKPPGTRVELFEPHEKKSLTDGKVVSVLRPDARLERWEVDVKLFAPSKGSRARLEGFAKDAPCLEEC